MSICPGIIGAKIGKGLGPCLAQLIIDGALMTLEQSYTLVHASHWGLRVIDLHGLAQFGTKNIENFGETLTSDNHWGLV